MALVPGVDIFDAHTHIGLNDPDGFRASGPDIVAALELAGARGVVFPFQEPDGYRAANRDVLAAADESGGRLVAFCRLDPRHEDAAREAEQFLDEGARGIKLHPRAERFALDEPELRDVFRLAQERRAPVLIHAGRGIPALGRHAAELAREFPRAPVILAHCGISDLSWIWREAEHTPNLYFDTSWWSPADVFATLTLVPPGQVLFASDAPYGTPLQHSLFVLRCALQVRLSHDQVRSVMGGQIEQLVNAREPLDMGPAPGTRGQAADVLLARVGTFLTSAISRLFAELDTEEALALARLSCYTGGEEPHRAVFASILRLIDLFEREAAGSDDFGPGAQGAHLLLTALCLTATPDVPVPVPGDV